MRRLQRFGGGLAAAVLCGVLPWLVTAAPPPEPANRQGEGLVIELDNQFIKNYENRATITSEVTISGISAVHKPAADGEVHVGGWVKEAGLAGVSEVMNAATTGKTALGVFRNALQDKRPVSVTGAWRLWGEHAGTTPQLQALNTQPQFPLPGEFSSNPDHVFEIHPVTTVTLGGNPTDAAQAIGKTTGFTPHDATQAFVLGYEKLPCKIIPSNGRTKIITHSLGFNFTAFVIRLGENPVPLQDGHGVICSVYDEEGELLVRHRRMVFVKGTDADKKVQNLKKDARMDVIGIPRISLKLIQWRLDHRDKDENGKPFDVSPLLWNLPYEMIIVSATPLPPGPDDE